MDLDLALTIADNRNRSYEQSNQTLLEESGPRVRFRETRSSYFLDINLPGLRKEDVWLQMDNTRALIIRGQRCMQDIGMVEWTWHLIERGGSRRRPFKIPRDVNVAAVTASFRHGVLHVVMPKFRWSKFSPYHINGRSSGYCHLQLYPSIQTITQGCYAHQAGRMILQSQIIPDEEAKSGEGISPTSEPVRGEIERPLPTNPEKDGEMSVVITIEEQCVDVPAENQCLSQESHRLLVEEMMEEQEATCNVSPCGNLEDKQPVPIGVRDSGKCELPCSDSREEIIEDLKGHEEMFASSSEMSTTVSNADVREERASAEEEDDCEKGKLKGLMSGEEKEEGKGKAEDSRQWVMSKGLSHLFSSIATMAARKVGRG